MAIHEDTAKINALAACNVPGRLRLIRDVVEKGQTKLALGEIDILLAFIEMRNPKGITTGAGMKKGGK